MSFSASDLTHRTRRLQYVTFILAVAILIAAFFLARKQETQKIVHDTTWLNEEQRLLAGFVESLEKQWRDTVAATAELEWAAEEGQRGEAAANTFGVKQVTFFKDKIPEHIALSQKQTTLPILKPYVTGGKGDFLLSQEIMKPSVDGSWISQSAILEFYILHKNPSRAVVLLLDREEVLGVIVEEVKKKIQASSHLRPEHGYFEVSQGNISLIFQSGDEKLNTYPSDEKIRHFSNLGEWTFRYWHVRETRIHYRMSILVIGALLAFVTLITGWWFDREYQRIFKLAASRVSFVNAVSHELRTPLTNIILSSDFMDESLESLRNQRSIHQIREESHRLARMVENVLNFSRFEAGKLIPNQRHDIDVGVLLENCLRQFKPSFDRKNISIETEVKGASVFYTDPDFLAQILLNLLSNIEKYAGRESSAKILVETTASHFRMLVEDDGPGIAPEYAQRIFKSFERIDETILTEVSGAGLGLSISRELAHQLGGDLTLEPSNNGASFQLLISLN